MDSVKGLHITCSIDVRHAVVQFFIIVNLSSHERWPWRKMCTRTSPLVVVLLFMPYKTCCLWEPSMAERKMKGKWIQNQNRKALKRKACSLKWR
uniref:Uncharacterized protein n=1 Tax=Romanomermis culicivorax TaxID=13658 RepID=A0A915LBB1_ROMCU